MPKYINPFTDFGFKKLFGEESAKELLISFLNEILAEDEVHIEDITYLNTEQFGASEDHRKAFFDLYCRNQNGEHFIVEIQRQKQKNFKDRLIFYSTFPIQNQSIKGDWTFEQTPVYVIAILDFILDERNTSENKVLSRVKLMDIETCELFYSKLTYIYLEVPKFKKSAEELFTLFDKWLFLLGNLTFLERIPPQIQEQLFMKFLDRAEVAKLTDEDRYKYERSLKVYRDDLLVMNTAREEGFENGFEKGRKERLEEVQIETRLLERLKVARKLIENGADTQLILSVTGLTFDELVELKASL